MLGVTDPTINVIKNKSQYFLPKGLEKLYNSFLSKLFLAIVFNYYPPPPPLHGRRQNQIWISLKEEGNSYRKTGS